MLITGKKDAPFRASRQLQWDNGHWCVIDELQAQSWKHITTAGIGCDQSFNYVVIDARSKEDSTALKATTQSVEKTRSGAIAAIKRYF